MGKENKAPKGYWVFFAILFALMLLLYPQASLAGARIGLSRWWDVVLPSLLPFMVVSAMLLETRALAQAGRLLGRVLAPVFGLPPSAAPLCLLGPLGGYPLGARFAGELHARGELDSRDMLISLLVGNVAGPVFIIGAVSVGLLGDVELALPMLLGYYLSVWITGWLFARIFPPTAPRPSRTVRPAPQERPAPHASADFSGALIRSIDAILRIGACMILASALLAILGHIRVLDALQKPLAAVLAWFSVPGAAAAPLLQGALEMTAGCAELAGAAAPLLVRASFSAGILAFGGASIFLQTRSLARVRLLPLIMGKLINALLAVLLTSALIRLFVPEAASVFAPIAVPAPGNQWLFALVLLAVTGIPLAVTALYAHLSKQAPRTISMRKQK